MSLVSIPHAFAQLRREHAMRHRDIAAKLGLSEGELIAAHIGVKETLLNVQGLKSDWHGLLSALEPLGEVMALSRNAVCVHENIGVYRQLTLEAEVGIAHDGGMDARLFYRHWAHGFVVEEALLQGGVQRSLQFFDSQGMAIHKIFLRPASVLSAYQALCTHFIDPDTPQGLNPVSLTPSPTLADEQVDVPALRQAVSMLEDTHDFFALLQRFSVGRLQALRLLGSQYAQAVEPDSLTSLLHGAADKGVSIMVFVSNRGILQIHTGPLKTVCHKGPWLNVFDPSFVLHVYRDRVASSWVVKKPTRDGLVTSLELFDAQGELVALFFGERSLGQAESSDWRQLIATLSPFEKPHFRRNTALLTKNPLLAY